MVSRAGFSLVEALVALGLLSVGVLGAVAGGVLATRLLRDAEAQDAAANRAAVLVDSLLADSVAGSGREQTSQYEITWTAARDSAIVTLRLPDSATYVLRGIR